MKAAFVTRYGGPEVLEIRDAPIPRPGAREVLVRVRAIGLNFADVFARLGVYPGTPKAPFVPGLEFSGVVVAVGDQVTGFKGRERVMGYSRLGSHAEYVKVSEEMAGVVPDAMTFEDAASFLVSYLTAYHGLIRLAHIRAGEKLLVHAAAGGVGIATVQLAKHLGAEVFATAGTDEKVQLAGQHGADHPINYASTDFAEAVRRASGGYGVDVVMDSVGGDVYRKSWNLLAPMGRYILYGVSAVTGTGSLSRIKAAREYSHMKPIFPPSLIGANKGIFGFNLGTLRGAEKYFREAMMELLKLYEHGVLRPLIGRVFPFEKIVDAHAFLQARRSVGKVVVTVGG